MITLNIRKLFVGHPTVDVRHANCSGQLSASTSDNPYVGIGSREIRQAGAVQTQQYPVMGRVAQEQGHARKDTGLNGRRPVRRSELFCFNSK